MTLLFILWTKDVLKRYGIHLVVFFLHIEGEGNINRKFFYKFLKSQLIYIGFGE